MSFWFCWNRGKIGYGIDDVESRGDDEAGVQPEAFALYPVDEPVKRRVYAIVELSLIHI